MLNQNNTLEELMNFTDKIYLLESKMRLLLSAGYLFNSNSYFNSIEILLNEHKLNIHNIVSTFRENDFGENKFKHNII